MSETTPSQNSKSSSQAESRDNRIRRLIYRSSYTGTKETDKLLGAFSREVLPNLTDAELDLYEDLLDLAIQPYGHGLVSKLKSLQIFRMMY